MIPYLIPNMPTTQQLIPYLKEIDNNRWYSNFGPLYLQFRQRIADECLKGLDKQRICLVSSGTSAIELALRSLELPEKSKVLTTCFTFPATVQAIIDANLTPVLADIDKNSWLLSPSIAQRNLKLHDIAAVVPVAAFGMPVDCDSWASFSEQTGLPVVVDAAAAILNQDINPNLYYAFSLHATKPVGAGEGGVIVCPAGQSSEQIKRMSNFGFEADRSIYTYGTNAKISEYHCAVGLAQLDRIETIKQRSSHILNTYQCLLDQHNLKVQTQTGLDSCVPASFYVLFEQSTDGLFERLLEQGIESRRLYWPLIQGFPAFSDNTVPASLSFKNGNKVSSQGLALPFHNHLTDQDIENTVSTLSIILNKKTQQL